VMLERADAVVCVFRPHAWSVVHTRRRLESLQDVLRDRVTLTGVVCVAGHDRGADARAAVDGVISGLSWVQDLGVVADDPKAVVMYEGGVVYRPERSLLARSGSTVASRLYAGLAGAGVLSGEPAPEGVPDGDPALLADDGATLTEEPGKRADRTRGRRVLRRADR
jgi:hypothetical protein